MIYTVQQIKEKLTPILKENNVARSSVFGSAARGEDTPESDIDFG